MKQVDQSLTSKIQEFRIWAMTLGRYAPSTVKRAVRRVRSFSSIIDLFNPDQEKLLNFFAAEIEKGVKPHTINNQKRPCSMVQVPQHTGRDAQAQGTAGSRSMDTF